VECEWSKRRSPKAAVVAHVNHFLNNNHHNNRLLMPFHEGDMKMFRIETVSGTWLTVDADQAETRSDPGITCPCVRLFKDKELVFFAPFDSIIAMQKV
jgi:hypothetical protein